MRLIHNYITILNKYYPKVNYELDNETNTFKWLSEDHPTVEELDQLVTQENKKGDEEEVRSKRNKLLEESDYIVIKSLESGDAIPAKWKTYRQELRDINFSDYNNITWPEKP
tara:strand:- start:128 stop:463 length:336 start_codon:yes stop_codon:yes gene_type:complete